MKINKIILTAALLIHSSFAFAGNYLYHPKGELELGKGLSPENPGKNKRMCYMPFTPSTNNHGPQSELRIETLVAKSTYELKRILGIDSQIDASSLELDSGIRLHRDSTAIVIQATRQHGTRELPANAELANIYQAMIDSGNIDDFVKMCGSEVVSHERRAAIVSIIVYLDNVSQDERLTLSSFDGPISRSMERTLELMIQKHHASRSLRFDVKTIGTGVLNMIGGLIADAAKISHPEPIAQITNSLRAHSSQFSVENAASYAFATSIIHPDVESSYRNLFQVKLIALSGMVTHYRELDIAYREISKLFQDQPDHRINLFSDDELYQIKKALPYVNQYLGTLASSHARCIDAKSKFRKRCQIPATPVETSPFELARLILGY